MWAPRCTRYRLYSVRRTGYGAISGATHRIKPISGASRCPHPVHPPDVACIIRCVAPDVACIIRCTAPDLACIIRCISVPTSGALHRMWHVLSGALHRIWHVLSGASRCPHPVRCTGCGMYYPVHCTGSGMHYPVHLGAHIWCAAPDVACIIRCTAPDLACIIRCISVPTSGALHHRVRTPHHRVPRDGYSSRFPCGRARRSRQGTSAPVDGRNKASHPGRSAKLSIIELSQY